MTAIHLPGRTMRKRLALIAAAFIPAALFAA
jgi:hypothetical protein